MANCLKHDGELARPARPNTPGSRQGRCRGERMERRTSDATDLDLGEIDHLDASLFFAVLVRIVIFLEVGGGSGGSGCSDRLEG